MEYSPTYRLNGIRRRVLLSRTDNGDQGGDSNGPPYHKQRGTTGTLFCLCHQGTGRGRRNKSHSRGEGPAEVCASYTWSKEEGLSPEKRDPDAFREAGEGGGEE